MDESKCKRGTQTFSYILQHLNSNVFTIMFYFEFHTDKNCIYKVNPLIQESNSVVQLYWLIERVSSRRLGGVRGGSLWWESTDSIRLTVDNE